MVRGERVKFYYFPGSPDLYPGADGNVTTFSDNPINGRIQAVYYDHGNWGNAGSLYISVSGLPLSAGKILGMTSGTATGHHFGEDWVVFPRATTIETDATPIINYSGPSPAYAEIPIWSILKIEAGSFGAGSHASGLTIVYI